MFLATGIPQASSKEPLVRQPGLVRPAVPGAAESRDGTRPVTTPRRVIQNLKRADELLEQKKYADALPYLQGLLDEAGDSFLPSATAPPTLGSLKAAVEERISRLPAEGRTSYELQFGAPARQMLLQAIAEGDSDALSSVATRYWFTTAGRDAAWHAARRRLDEGRPREAVLLLHRLHRRDDARAEFDPGLSLRLALALGQTGESEEAARVLEKLSERLPNLTVATPAGAGVSLVDAAARREWLKQLTPDRPASSRPTIDWSQPGLLADRSRVAGSDGPKGSPVWGKGPNVTTFDPFKLPDETTESPFDRVLSSAIDQLTSDRRTSASKWITRNQPILVGKTLVARTLGQIRAWDATTGQRRWETLPDATLEAIVFRDPPPTDTTPALREHVRQRLWNDAACGGLATDGRRVFAVQEAGLAVPVDDADPKRRMLPIGFNRLCAYEVESGQTLWELGGAPGEYAVDEAGTFFLGAPLVSGSMLYVLGESAGALRVLAVDPAGGKVRWSQPLADVDPVADATRDPQRRLAGLSPSSGSGVLVCSTGAGLVVAVDLESRRLRWQSKLPDEFPASAPIPRQPQPQPEASPDWIDRGTIVTDSLALVPVAGGRSVRALSIDDGRETWAIEADDLPKSPRWMALSEDRKGIAIVGEASVRLYDVATGKPRGRRAAPIPTVTGIGFVAGGRLVIPGRTLDVGRATGQLTVLTFENDNAPRSSALLAGVVPGNLITGAAGTFSQNALQIVPLELPAR